jgi:hypothetical protein
VFRSDVADGTAEEATGFFLRRDPDIAICDLLSQISEKDWRQQKEGQVNEESPLEATCN